MEKKYKIIVAYDGTGYHGWQAQPGKATIAGTLQDSFAKVFDKKITIRGVSRTDTGVHALGQVATFITDLAIDAHALIYAWNNLLPEQIVIQSIVGVPLDYNFHADVAYKTYHYTFFTERPLPIASRFGWYYRKQVDMQKLNQCLQLFIGTYDFKPFSTGDERGSDTLRTITGVGLATGAHQNSYIITISGPKFLHHMVRRIVGACLHVASHPELNIGILKQVLTEKNYVYALPNAPAKGLLLYNVQYNPTGDLNA